MSNSLSRRFSLGRAPAVLVRAGLALVVGAMVAWGGGCAAAHRDPGSEPLTPEVRAKYVESFDVVWQTIKDKHFDPKLNGADWDGAKAELRPKVEVARTPNDARSVMGVLIDRLGQSHFGIIPSDVYAKQKSVAAAGSGGGAGTSAGGSNGGAGGGRGSGGATTPPPVDDADEPESDEGGLGIDLRLIDDKPVVFRVEQPSAGASAGVRPGWILSKINGTSIDRRMSRLKQVAEHSTISPELVRTIVLSRELRGTPGKAIDVEFLDAHDKPVALHLTFDKPAGVDAAFGNLVGVRMRSETRALTRGIGYYSFNIFAAPTVVMPELAKAVDGARDGAGFIIDLRGNPGGIGAMAMGMGGFFVTNKDQKLGTMSTRDSKLNFVLNPRLNPYTKPLVILIDGGSASTSEILAGGLKDLKRAHIIGTRSAGAALPSVITRLPSGDGFQYAFANYISVGGQELEGKGVTPDEIIPLTRAGLLTGEDPQIEAAVRWILSQNAPSGAS